MSVIVRPKLVLSPGDTKQVDAQAFDEAGVAIAGQSVNWTTSAAGVATVAPASGAAAVVTAVGVGAATITGTIPATPPTIPADIVATLEVTVVAAVARLSLVPR